jgi:predicted small integral membrane protein
MINWIENLDFAWMAWTWQTALFFALIACTLVIMTLLAIFFPEVPRQGALKIASTRGDRLFITLLGSAFICLIWIAVSTAIGTKDVSLWWAVGISLIYGAAVFRFV